MPSGVVYDLPAGANVVVLRMRSLGDIILTTPAISLLKRARPDLSITVVVAEPFAGLLAGHPDISNELVDSYTHLPPFQTLRAIRRLKPALCLDLYGRTYTVRWTWLSGARYRAGYGHVRGSFLYDIKIPRAQETLGVAEGAPIHTAEQHASAVFRLGVPICDIPRASLHAEPEKRESPYAVVHIAAAHKTKEWPVGRFREIGKILQDRHGLEPVFIAAPGRGDMLKSVSEFPCFDNLTLARLKSLIAGSTLFVGNDSGPAHVAAAFGVPTVVIFGSSYSVAWRPWRTVGAVVQNQWDCNPCKGDRCYAFDEPRCILSVETHQVERAIEQVLTEARAANPPQGV